ncbi:MAG TPA: adenosylhomocysteinase, partial [Synergistales bacterium]|nr:adenosylhomocysteinase [Synergistales bacterium]
MDRTRIADPSLAPEGKKKILWAWQRMAVLSELEKKYLDEQPLSGITVGACLHLEAKTACLLLTLQKLGATVAAAGSNPLSTQDDVCAALVEEGVRVFSRRGMTAKEYGENLRSVLDHRPGVIIDDGADLVVMVHEERPETLGEIYGGSEETTTGVKRLKAMERENILAFPMISVND